jgi:hypothetical protein
MAGPGVLCRMADRWRGASGLAAEFLHWFSPRKWPSFRAGHTGCSRPMAGTVRPDGRILELISAPKVAKISCRTHEARDTIVKSRLTSPLQCGLRCDQPVYLIGRVKESAMQCPVCGRSMENVGPDPSQLPQWACRSSRCLNSIHHKDAKCPKCGKPPAEITDGGVGYTAFLCEDGHPFMTSPTPRSGGKASP